MVPQSHLENLLELACRSLQVRHSPKWCPSPASTLTNPSGLFVPVSPTKVRSVPRAIPGGEGKLFSIELVDESGEIRATAFNEQVDKFFPLIEVNKVYYFSKGTLKIANKQFSAVKNDYEMIFNNETSVLPCEDGHHLPTVQFDFIGIGDLESKSKDSLVDIIGICKSYEDSTKITVRSNNREVAKRNMDMSGKVVTTTLWGEDTDKFEGSRQPVMAIKGARVSDFGGRSLSVLSSSTVIVNPDIPEAYKLRGW